MICKMSSCKQSSLMSNVYIYPICLLTHNSCIDNHKTTTGHYKQLSEKLNISILISHLGVFIHQFLYVFSLHLPVAFLHRAFLSSFDFGFRFGILLFPFLKIFHRVIGYIFLLFNLFIPHFHSTPVTR